MLPYEIQNTPYDVNVVLPNLGKPARIQALVVMRETEKILSRELLPTYYQLQTTKLRIRVVKSHHTRGPYSIMSCTTAVQGKWKSKPRRPQSSFLAK